MVLGRRVRGAWSRTYCGGTRTRAGSLRRCSAALAASLRDGAPVAADPQALYSGSDCPAGDQVCWEEIRFRPLGGVTQPPLNWINRPTFQQAVEVPARRRASPGRPFAYPPR